MSNPRTNNLMAKCAVAIAGGATISGWATESLLAAREAYQDPGTGQRMKPGAKLADDCQARSLPVVKRRLYEAGARGAFAFL
jgi:hypothetical protein